MVVHEDRTNFSELQAELAAGRQDRLLHYAFDLLWPDGEDLRRKPQIERKAKLQKLFEAHELGAPLLYSDHLVEMAENVRARRQARLGRHCLQAC